MKLPWYIGSSLPESIAHSCRTAASHASCNLHSLLLLTQHCSHQHGLLLWYISLAGAAMPVDNTHRLIWLAARPPLAPATKWIPFKMRFITIKRLLSIHPFLPLPFANAGLSNDVPKDCHNNPNNYQSASAKAMVVAAVHPPGQGKGSIHLSAGQQASAMPSWAHSSTNNTCPDLACTFYRELVLIQEGNKTIKKTKWNSSDSMKSESEIRDTLEEC